ncbi:MAG: aspartate dehydrogenase [Alicyclobacillus sp.]|nr:aspartate dehydrogenase [Alicyclobacillus sp.]
MKVGIIGYGAIGRDVAARLRRGSVPGAELGSVLVRRTPSSEDPPELTNDAERFLNSGVQLVVEAAGQEALRSYGLQVVERGISLAVISVGALTDDAFADELRRRAETSGARVYFPSCAIAGLDRIAAAREGNLNSVRLVTRKPVRAWYGTIAEQRFDLASLTEPVVLYTGTAREAARLFPESVNVSAALALAGVGMDETKVEVWIDPTLTSNVHQVHVEGDFGRFSFEVMNRPSENPKTGVIVAMSVVKLVRNLVGPFVVGV